MPARYDPEMFMHPANNFGERDRGTWQLPSHGYFKRYLYPGQTKDRDGQTRVRNPDTPTGEDMHAWLRAAVIQHLYARRWLELIHNRFGTVKSYAGSRSLSRDRVRGILRGRAVMRLEDIGTALKVFGLAAASTPEEQGAEIEQAEKEVREARSRRARRAPRPPQAFEPAGPDIFGRQVMQPPKGPAVDDFADAFHLRCANLVDPSLHEHAVALNPFKMRDDAEIDIVIAEDHQLAGRVCGWPGPTGIWLTLYLDRKWLNRVRGLPGATLAGHFITSVERVHLAPTDPAELGDNEFWRDDFDHRPGDVWTVHALRLLPEVIATSISGHEDWEYASSPATVTWDDEGPHLEWATDDVAMAAIQWGEESGRPRHLIRSP